MLFGELGPGVGSKSFISTAPPFLCDCGAVCIYTCDLCMFLYVISLKYVFWNTMAVMENQLFNGSLKTEKPTEELG